MKILLINLPSPALAEPWSNFPLGLGYVAASLERRGLDVSVLDLCRGIKDLKALPKATIYGLSVTTPQLGYAKQLAAIIKKHNPKSLVVSGGPHVLIARNDFLSEGLFDAVVVEEGEFSFYELIRHYELYGKVEQVYWNPPIRLMDDIPFPARHLFPKFKQTALRIKQLLKGGYTDGGQTTIIASRGCPWKCSFCAPHPRKVRFRSPQNVIEELREIIERFGIYQFKWQDDTFTINQRWVLELCDLIKNKLPKTYHRCHTRVDSFTEEMAEAMHDAGFKILCFGIESFSQKVLDMNIKSVTIDQIENALTIAKKYNFTTMGFLIFGMPGEDWKSITETKEGIIRNKQKLDYLNLATMVPLPGTPIYENPDQFNCQIVEKDFSRFWIVDHEISDTVLVRNKDVRLEDMRKMKTDMYQFMRDEGYSRPEWKN
jgi:anaerobic magnesium-protoporphyrin IX monomethyl ester cyclase